MVTDVMMIAVVIVLITRIIIMVVGPGGGRGGDPSDRVQVRAALLAPAAGQGPAQAAPPQQDRTGEVVFP